jgi:choline monooxygenase
MASFHIDPDISKARTLAADFYNKTKYLEEAKEKIFSQCWQFVGDTDQVREPGWVTPVHILENYLNEPVLLSRDKQGQLHCLSNVCTHRGNLIVENACKVNDLRCKYHGRRFALDGKFLSMPEFKEVKDFPAPEDNLTHLSLHQWGKWLFSTLSGDLPAEDFFKEMTDRVAWMPFDQFVFRPDLSRDYKVEANWALYCENFLEGFHIPFVHAGLNSLIDYGSYSVELNKYSSLQIGIAKDNDNCFDLPPSSPDYGKKVAGYYFWIFPNMMFNFYPWGLSINVVKPIAAGKCVVSFMAYVWDENKLRQGAGAALHQVELEDEDIVQNVQKGIRSRFYNYGRYSATREQGTHHFHRLIAEFMQ